MEKRKRKGTKKISYNLPDVNLGSFSGDTVVAIEVEGKKQIYRTRVNECRISLESAFQGTVSEENNLY